MKTDRVDKAEQLDQVFSVLDGKLGYTSAYRFRGQANIDWGLIPSFARCIPKGTSVAFARQLESLSMRKFLAQAHIHLAAPELPANLDELSLLATMQQYRAPTRLLDWTISPYVAAYFACEGDLDSDGAIWYFHLASLNQHLPAWDGNALTRKVLTEYLNGSPSGHITPYHRTTMSQRMVAQQGVFTVGTSPIANHGEILQNTLDPLQQNSGLALFGKIEIAREVKMELLAKFLKMNLTASALFPGADGVGRSVGELIRVACAFNSSAEIVQIESQLETDSSLSESSSGQDSAPPPSQ